MDPKPNDATVPPVTVPSVPVSILPSKRKRGRPTKVPSAAMVISPKTGIEPPVVDVVRVSIDPIEDASTPPVVSTSPSPAVKKSPVRQQKHPLPNPDEPVVKRKRGRPPKSKPPPAPVVPETDESDKVMFVPPPELVSEPAQVSIAQIPISHGISQNTEEGGSEDVLKPPSPGAPTLEKPAMKKMGRPPKKPRGRPKKVPASAVEMKAPITTGESAGPDPASNQTVPVKRGRGRPRKNPLPTNPAKTQSKENPEEPAVKRKRGRPRKVTAVSKDPPLSSDVSKPNTNEFNLVLSSDSEADENTINNAVAMLKKHSNDTSPFLVERFVESSDDED